MSNILQAVQVEDIQPSKIRSLSLAVNRKVADAKPWQYVSGVI